MKYLILLLTLTSALAQKPVETLTLAEQALFRDSLNVGQVGSHLQTRNTIGRIVAVTDTANMTPLRIGVWGDSVSTSIGPSAWMAPKGTITGAGGTYAGGAAIVTGATSIWPTGRYDNVPNGGSVIYRHSGANDVAGDQLAIYYIRESTGGTFNVEVSSNGGSSWTAATGGTGLSANNASTIGAVFTATLSTTNFPSYRVRVTGASGNGVKIIGWGIYYTGAHGGVVFSSGLLNLSGNNWSDQVLTPTAILNPILQSANFDLLISRSQDFASEWASGGNFRTMYSRLKTALPNCDLVIMSSNPQSNAVDSGGVNYAAALANQRAFCAENRETFVDASSWIGGYTEGVTRGIMANDDVGHMTASGYAMSNLILWDSLFLGKIPLGRLPLVHPSLAASRASTIYSFITGVNDRTWMETDSTLRVGGMRIANSAVPEDVAWDFNFAGGGTSDVMLARFGSSNALRIKQGVGGGITAPTDGGANCGFPGFRFTGFFTTLDTTGATSFSNASITMAGLPVHADNAAAVGAGLAAGRFYRTSTGEVRVVIP